MAGCEAGAAAGGGGGGEGGVSLELEGADGGVLGNVSGPFVGDMGGEAHEVSEGSGRAVHGSSALNTDLGFWSG